MTSTPPTEGSFPLSADAFMTTARALYALTDFQLTKVQRMVDEGHVDWIIDRMPGLISLVNSVGYMRGQDGHFLEDRPREITEFQKELYAQEDACEKRLQTLIDTIHAHPTIEQQYKDRLERYLVQSRIVGGNTVVSSMRLFWIEEFVVFGLKQAQACVFAGAFFLLLFLSHKLPLGPIHRYDFLFVAALFLQIILYLTKVETKDEIKTIALFHLIGLCLELFKTSPQIAAWSYPEPGFFKIATVPLYSGFMYAAVGSYISQSWRIMRLKLTGNVHYTASAILASAIYLNFFTNPFFPDARWILIPLVFVVFHGVHVHFTVRERTYRMPISLSFGLIAFFIWIAENISTYLGAWKYPHQLGAWDIVSFKIISSWYLLVIISFILVAYLKHLKQERLPSNKTSAPPTDGSGRMTVG